MRALECTGQWYRAGHADTIRRNVFPSHVEKLLAALPQVREVAR